MRVRKKECSVHFHFYRLRVLDQPLTGRSWASLRGSERKLLNLNFDFLAFCLFQFWQNDLQNPLFVFGLCLFAINLSRQLHRRLKGPVTSLNPVIVVFLFFFFVLLFTFYAKATKPSNKERTFARGVKEFGRDSRPHPITKDIFFVLSDSFLPQSFDKIEGDGEENPFTGFTEISTNRLNHLNGLL